VPEADPRALKIAQHVQAILDELRLDPRSDPNLVGTPERVAGLYLELLSGLDPVSQPDLTTFPNDAGYNEVVSLRAVPVYSLCAHHLVPFFGAAHVAYVPAERIIGLSKVARAIDFFARRPQVQERLTQQVVECLDEALRPVGAMLVIDARHLCMEMRGVRLPGTITRTVATRGLFEQNVALRSEFLGQLTG
jgi:GTP cyclohydrolase I